MKASLSLRWGVLSYLKHSGTNNKFSFWYYYLICSAAWATSYYDLRKWLDKIESSEKQYNPWSWNVISQLNLKLGSWNWFFNSKRHLATVKSKYSSIVMFILFNVYNVNIVSASYGAYGNILLSYAGCIAKKDFNFPVSIWFSRLITQNLLSVMSDCQSVWSVFNVMKKAC